MARAWHGWACYIFGVGAAAVCFDAALAVVLLDAGIHVVLCGPDGAALGELAAARRGGAGAGAGGRVAVMVGEPAAVEADAVAMATELFGGMAVVVRSPAEAAGLVAAATGLADPAKPPPAGD